MQHSCAVPPCMSRGGSQSETDSLGGVVLQRTRVSKCHSESCERILCVGEGGYSGLMGMLRRRPLTRAQRDPNARPAF
eukprot:scaffold88602_cov64-Phaeocystis_antarctica.AAC.3